MENIILSAQSINKKFNNGVTALNNITLDIKEGEFVVVIGPSGSGKSTFLRSINKLVDITSGDMLIEGEAISNKSGSSLRVLRRKIAMVFQHYNLVYRLSVMQNVLHGKLGYMKGIKGIFGVYSEADKEQAIEILNELGLGDHIYNRAGELSGGQKQRVGIARAIMQEPKIILCDEPIASLDPSSSKVIMDMVFKMAKKRNITCIVNLHQIDVALKYATRIIGLKKGEVVFDGSPEKLDLQTIEGIYGTKIEDLMISGEFKNE